METIKNKKGNTGWMVIDWDMKGTWFYQEVKIISCGKKQMILQDAVSDITLGYQFKPDLPLYISEEIAKGKALKAANNFIENEIHWLEIRIKDHQYDESAYKKELERRLNYFNDLKGKGRAIKYQTTRIIYTTKNKI